MKFVNDNEKVHYQINPKENNSIATQIYITEQYLYAQTKLENNKTNTHIVKLKEIKSVSVKETIEQKSAPGCIIFGIILIITAIALFIGFENALFLIISVVGLILLIVGLKISSPKYFQNLCINADGYIEIPIEDFNSNDIEKLQLKIFELQQQFGQDKF